MNIVAITEYNKSFHKSYQSTHQETSEVTNDFNHSSKDCVNFICTDLSAPVKSTQNDGQSSG